MLIWLIWFGCLSLSSSINHWLFAIFLPVSRRLCFRLSRALESKPESAGSWHNWGVCFFCCRFSHCKFSLYYTRHDSCSLNVIIVNIYLSVVLSLMKTILIIGPLGVNFVFWQVSTTISNQLVTVTTRKRSFSLCLIAALHFWCADVAAWESATNSWSLASEYKTGTGNPVCKR